MINAILRFTPIRMVSGQREPVTLNVYLVNKFSEPVLVSVIARVPASLGFDKAGIVSEKRERVGFIEPGEEKLVSFPIYGKFGTRPGKYPIQVKVLLHEDRYDKIKNEYKFSTELKVIER